MKLVLQIPILPEMKLYLSIPRNRKSSVWNSNNRQHRATRGYVWNSVNSNNASKLKPYIVFSAVFQTELCLQYLLWPVEHLAWQSGIVKLNQLTWSTSSYKVCITAAAISLFSWLQRLIKFERDNPLLISSSQRSGYNDTFVANCLNI